MAPIAKAGAGLGIARLAHATGRRRDAAAGYARAGAAGWARPCRQWGAMMLWRLCQALGRSVRRSAVCHVTYPTGRAQNGRQNVIQRALWHALGPRGACCGLSWGLPCPHVPCQAARASAPRAGAALCAGQPFDGTRGAAPNLAGAGLVRCRRQLVPQDLAAPRPDRRGPTWPRRSVSCGWPFDAGAPRRRARSGLAAAVWPAVGASWGARVVRRVVACSAMPDLTCSGV